MTETMDSRESATQLLGYSAYKPENHKYRPRYHGLIVWLSLHDLRNRLIPYGLLSCRIARGTLPTCTDGKGLVDILKPAETALPMPGSLFSQIPGRVHMSCDTWEQKIRSGVLLSSLIELLFDTILSTTCMGRFTHVCFHPQISYGVALYQSRVTVAS